MKLYYLWIGTFCVGCDCESLEMKDLFFKNLEGAKIFANSYNYSYVVMELDVETQKTRIAFRGNEPKE